MNDELPDKDTVVKFLNTIDPGELVSLLPAFLGEEEVMEIILNFDEYRMIDVLENLGYPL